MTDIALTPVTTGYNISNINSNFTKLQTSINGDVVHLVGGNNVMSQNLDMNSFKILNTQFSLSAPVLPSDAVRLVDLQGESSVRAAADTVLQINLANEAVSRVSGDAVTLQTAKTYAENLTAGIVGGTGFFVQTGVGAQSRTFQDKQREVFSLLDFKQTADGTNLIPAFNRAITARLAAGGGVIELPAGIYNIPSPIIIDLSTQTSDMDPRIIFRGAGKNATVLNYTGTTGACLDIRGGSGAALQSYFRMSDLCIKGISGQANGIKLDNIAFSSFEDILVTGFLGDGTIGSGGYGWYMTDVLSSSWRGCETRVNKYGMYCARADNSDPNALTFIDCDFACKEWGMYLIKPTTLNFYGGSIQGCGNPGTEVVRWGVKCDNAGNEGAVACNFDGTYFEFNSGTADFLAEQTLAASNVTYSFKACTFNRISNTVFTTNNISIAVSNGAKAIVNVQSCGFKSFGTYISSTSRKYIVITGPDNAWQFSDGGSSNYYQDSNERPTLAGPIRTGPAMAGAWVRFVGSTAAINAAFNATVTRTSTGLYVITYGKAFSSGAQIYMANTSLSGYVEIVTETPSSVTIQTKNTAGTLTDFSFVNLVVYSADIT